MSTSKKSYETRDTLQVGSKEYQFYNMQKLAKEKQVDLSKIPFSIRVLLENALRNEDGRLVTKSDIDTIAAYDANNVSPNEIPYMPARVVLQDFTGVPAVVDLAVMRDAISDFSGDPARINPVVRADLVIDHSVQVDAYGTQDAYLINTKKEFERNKERYSVMRWAQPSSPQPAPKTN